MRAALVDTLIEQAETDARVFLVTGDLGWSVVERFAARFPDRFLNVGVAEANAAGVAAGLAASGFLPFVYSIASFASMRCYEQVRSGALLNGLPVRIVGIGGGFAYGTAGATHYALEDVAMMRCQPAMTVLVPADPAQTRSVVRATMSLPGPAYLRVGKGGNAEVPGLGGRFALSRPELLRAGSGPLLLCSGPVVHEVLGAAAALAGTDVDPAVAVLAHVGFQAGPALVELLAKHRHVIVVEEAFVAGGLGSLAAEAIALNGLSARLLIRGVQGPLAPSSGSEAFMRREHGLDAASIAAASRAWLDRSA